MGGNVAMTAAAAAPDAFAGVVSIDSYVRTVRVPGPAERRAVAPRRTARFATHGEAIRRFRLLPEDPYVLPYVFDHVAAHSATSADGGWAWKTDPAVFRRERPASVFPRAVRVAVFRAEHGLVTAKEAARVRRILGRSTVVRLLPATGHHVPLAIPLELIAALRSQLSAWHHRDC
jgi:pimeloyl-ACP methyl ester carboxylesterase